MSDFPIAPSTPRVLHGAITSNSLNCCAGTFQASKATFSAGAWPSANLAIALPITVNVQVTVYQIYWENGATVSGNIDVAIYDQNWNRKVSAGSTAQSGVSTAQAVDIADTTLSAGVYFMAMSVDNTTATVKRASGYNALIFQSLGVQQQALGSVTLPDPFVPVNPTNGYVPYIGLDTLGATF